MHIHVGHLNPGLASNRSEAALAARRAETTRKKLLGSAADIAAASGEESAWTIQMAGAWAGSESANSQAAPRQSLTQTASDQPEPARNPAQPPVQNSTRPHPDYPQVQPVTRATPSAPVSFWA